MSNKKSHKHTQCLVNQLLEEQIEINGELLTPSQVIYIYSSMYNNLHNFKPSPDNELKGWFIGPQEDWSKLSKIMKKRFPLFKD